MTLQPVRHAGDSMEGQVLDAQWGVGIYLPTTIERTGRRIPAGEVADAARAAEDAGFSTLWAADHLLAPQTGYSVGWLDPFQLLSIAAAVTVGAALASGVVLAPLWTVPRFMKDVLNLGMLSSGRFVLGVGTGWYDGDYQLLGLEWKRRGKLLDEAISAVRDSARWAEDYGLPNTDIPVLAGGGARAVGAEAGEPTEMRPAVLRRILAADGWTSRPMSTPDQALADHALVAQELQAAGRSGFPMIHTVFVDMPWISREDELASDERIAAFCGSERPTDVMAACTVRGTLENMAEQVAERKAAGATGVAFLPITNHPGYVSRLAPLVELVS